MHSLFIVTFSILFFSLPANAQMDDLLGDPGPGDTVVNEDTTAAPDPPDWEDLMDRQWGARGHVEHRVPHDACEYCFTVRNSEGYTIYEYVKTDLEEDIIISRKIPNPAPLREGEVRETVEAETGEKVWYIGTQAFVGPMDTDPISDSLPLSRIAVKRIMWQHQSVVWDIAGVHGFGIGEHGFVVSLEPGMEDSIPLVPTELGGIPVSVVITEVLQDYGFEYVQFGPLPSGAGIATDWGDEYEQGTLGPHVVRDTPNVTQCCKFWSLTNAHIVKSDVTSSTVHNPVYQPAPSFTDDPRSIGHVAFAFTLLYCGSSSQCSSSTSPTSHTDARPDIAAIDTTDGFRFSPYNAPETDEDPVRELQYGEDSGDHVDGPSGRIKSARTGKKVKIWGALNEGSRGRIREIDECRVVTHEGNRRSRQCGLILISADEVQVGDSGALVTYRGVGNRHVVGVLSSGSGAGEEGYRAVIPADDIKTAMEEAGQGFNHYWGTKSEYRSPATE